MKNFERVAKKLELDKVFEQLKTCCSSSYGAELVDRMQATSNIAEALRWQQETSEARQVWRLYPLIPLGGIRNIKGSVERAKIGSCLEAHELLAVLDTLTSARRLKAFCVGLEGDYPLIKGIANEINVFRPIEEEIEFAVKDDGNLYDHASVELNRIRKQIKQLQERIKDKLENIIRASETQKMLQEALITVRGDRYVVPVKIEYRSQFPGLVHDQSASGATLFVEPMAVVELNNELRREVAAEKREIEVILQRLTRTIALDADKVLSTLKAVAQLDFIFAKGQLSVEMDGVQPELNTNGTISIRQGRHPLLKGKIVPITLNLGHNYEVLVITGPNTGGKTVTLKTVGLFTLMAQCGLHVPADVGTELAVFEQIFVDIGDEQSIEQSLSTFSSHMVNIVEITKRVDHKSLVLLDELGAGTDPAEGAALAVAILNFLRGRKARIIATTHYGQLKAYAYNTPGVQNASVEFDVETLQPTYRLLVGLPGRSNAFEIAQRLGLPEEIVSDAREFSRENDSEIAELIQRLTESRHKAEVEKQESERIRLELAKELANLKEERANLKLAQNDILQRSKEKAEEIIRQARKDTEELVGELRARLRREGQIAYEEAIREAREKIKKSEAQLHQLLPEAPIEHGPVKVRIGDIVSIPRLGLKATVLTEPNSQDEILVQAGIMKVSVKTSEIKKAQVEKVAVEARSSIRVDLQKIKEMPLQIDVRGATVEEALNAVDKYLDDAYLAGVPTISIIHGKGTGVLRAAITEFVKNRPQIQSFRLGSSGEGGAGVTVVEFRK
ncbi:MAG: endonuclease MutS2 [Bacillota bacterium]